MRFKKKTHQSKLRIQFFSFDSEQKKLSLLILFSIDFKSMFSKKKVRPP